MLHRGKCWIVGRHNGVGLEQDAALLTRTLSAEHWKVESFTPRNGKVLFNPFLQANVILHLERIFPLWKLKRGLHVLIPNQERYPIRQIGRLKHVHHVLCKSHHATHLFSNLHSSVHFIGFTSSDRSISNRTPDYSRFFHLAGKSTLKNTGLILKLWEKHPEWPVLTLVQHPSNAPSMVPSNVNLISRYLADDELSELQNSCGIHLCPSLSEGWGHYIAEAMSCRAVTLTTDAPPMNELLQADRGILVPYNHDEPRHLGRNFRVDPSQLENAITALIESPKTEKTMLGEAARQWFLSNDRDFSKTFPMLLSELSLRHMPA